MLQRVAIDEIRIGMYVEQIESNNTRAKIRQPGFIRREETIESLRQQNVDFVLVDLFQSQFVQPLVATEIPVGEQSSIPENLDLSAAKTLVDETKKHLTKILTNIAEGAEVEIAPLRELGSDIVNNIFERRDAVFWINGIREKSTYLLEHSLGVAFHLVNFGRYMGFDKPLLEDLAIGGLIHDIGKVMIRDEVLNKPGKLTDDEFVHMKEHQVLSQPILNSMTSLSQISRDVSLMHHEKLDGTGYPNRLKGDEISSVGRMSAIVDIFDALTTDRVYKPAMSPSEAFKVMISLTPFHLDTDLLKSFIRCVGFYPPGSVIELSNGRVGLVTQQNEDDMTKPTVKIFYSIRTGGYREVEYIDLKKHPDISIVRGLTEQALGTSFAEFR
ncbi:HD-GYP domain-containing protein [Veronia pacifica]|uniref:Phosphohydrolase n=1 Tax=Veronia pacifica TaxID=1080227 RepID=A0A1C3EMU7_9GAMM|nr:HD-GYP domain-containing protein [Veronia pacifica]ODA34552.1 phosphohydrolase [Veronia pacifica]